jgi:hypothetical protein
MSKHDEKLDHGSTVEHRIIGALDDKDLDKVTGGDKTVVLQHEKVTGGSTPTESVTFTYGGMQIDYGKQNP